MSKTIAIISCLDTKGREIDFTRKLINEQGYETLLIDVGVYSPPTIEPDITREEVCQAAGLDWHIVGQGEKKDRLQAMIKGVATLAPQLYAGGRIHGLLSIGGGANTAIGTVAMQALPIGVPKLMVSTVASGNRTFEPYVGTKDIMLMHSVADISGLNSVTKAVLQNAAGAMVGMVGSGYEKPPDNGKITIGASMLGVTTEGVERAVGLLEKRGYDVVSFHATGVGGRALEELILDGSIQATLDLTLHEITSEFFGEGYSFGANKRLEAAAKMGIPQVIAPGGIDVVDYAAQFLPAGWDNRKYIYQHPTVLHLKLYPDEMVEIAKIVAERLNQSNGPVIIVIPRKGFCQASFPGGPLWDWSADEAFINTLRGSIRPSIGWIEVDAHINEPEFSEVAARALLGLF